MVLYNISDDALRRAFSKKLLNQNYVEHSDQSTYALPITNDGDDFDISEFHVWFSEWCRGKAWSANDFVSIYYLDSGDNGHERYTIKNRFYPTKKK